MAKKMAMMAAKTMGSKKGCSCSIGKMLFGVLLIAAGLFAVVGGFQRQTAFPDVPIVTIFLYYVVGIFLIVVGTFFKRASYLCCEAHNTCM